MQGAKKAKVFFLDEYSKFISALTSFERARNLMYSTTSSLQKDLVKTTWCSELLPVCDISVRLELALSANSGETLSMDPISISPEILEQAKSSLPLKYVNVSVLNSFYCILQMIQKCNDKKK